MPFFLLQYRKQKLWTTTSMDIRTSRVRLQPFNPFRSSNIEFVFGYFYWNSSLIFDKNKVINSKLKLISWSIKPKYFALLGNTSWLMLIVQRSSWWTRSNWSRRDSRLSRGWWSRRARTESEIWITHSTNSLPLDQSLAHSLNQSHTPTHPTTHALTHHSD